MRRTVLVSLIAIVSIVAACSKPSTPVINSFTATPSSLGAGGGDVMLAWQVTGAASLRIEPGIGQVTGDSLLVRVEGTTTFTLFAEGQGGPVSTTVTVTVAGGVDSAAPTIVSVYPPDGADGVPADAVILVEFSESMNKAATGQAYISSAPGLEQSSVAISWNPAGTIMTVTPNAPLPYAQGSDVATVTALSFLYGIGNTARDLAGNPLAESQFTFSTLREITNRLPGAADQDGAVDEDGTVTNDMLDISVSGSSAGFLGFDIGTLPPDLSSDSIVAAKLLANGEYPCTVSPTTIKVEHVLYGPTLISAAATTVALHDNGFLAADEVGGCWNSADVRVSVADDWNNRASRGSRSQYRLTCFSCTMIFFAGEAAETAGDAQTKFPVLEVRYLVP